jgi:serine/threonine-protein kinase
VPDEAAPTVRVPNAGGADIPSSADGGAAEEAPAVAAPQGETPPATSPAASGSGKPPPSTELATVPAANRSPSFRPGVVIADKYVVERLIGEGGLGVVVAAKHAQLEQLVAIKYLRAKALSDGAVTERFVREARLAAKIRSDHVARVYDVGMLPSGAPYMVMEYLSGMDLGRMLGSTGPLPVWRAVEYVLQACDALGAAHAAGVVHCDIKPENLFVTTGASGAPLLKVLDFGISKLTPDRARVESSKAGEITVAGELFGTPAYMSPEQLLAPNEVDLRTDIWAIGVVLHQLLSGRLPFDGETLPELCSAIVKNTPVSLSDLRPDVPPGLVRSVERCLSKMPGDRFQRIADLRAEIGPYAAVTREQRVGQALRTLDAADRGRPPAPLPDELLTRALRAAPVPSFEDDRWVATTSSGVASTYTAPAIDVPDVKPSPKAKRLKLEPRIVAMGVAAAMVVGIAIVAMTAGSEDAADTESASAAKAPATSAPSDTQRATGPMAPANVGEPATVTATQTATPTPTAPPTVTPTPTATMAPIATATPSAPPPSRRHHRKGAASSGESGSAASSSEGAASTTPSSPAAAPSHAADPNAVINPFE